MNVFRLPTTAHMSATKETVSQTEKVQILKRGKHGKTNFYGREHSITFGGVYLHSI
jgi:hypothetical protein